MATHPIAGFHSAPGLVNADAFATAYTNMAQLAGTKVEGNTEAVTKRLDELTVILGTLAEGLPLSFRGILTKRPHPGRPLSLSFIFTFLRPAIL